MEAIMHFVSFWWNYIPWWIFVIIAVVVFGFCWQFIAPIWAVLPKPIKIALAFIGSILIAAQWGRNRARKDIAEEQKSRDAAAVQTRDKIDDEIKRLPPDAVDQRLRDNKWLRD